MGASEVTKIKGGSGTPMKLWVGCMKMDRECRDAGDFFFGGAWCCKVRGKDN